MDEVLEDLKVDMRLEKRKSYVDPHLRNGAKGTPARYTSKQQYQKGRKRAKGLLKKRR